ncbi:CDP-archaeol synthase [candidate division CSSED10-310 bacterium]|uniref:CDP-archaeol synthase n=1 Tax=candidate division CSSED10-310 bacterium TaxID=2855610 RepID=A0ABV6Z143_UNCC1
MDLYNLFITTFYFGTPVIFAALIHGIILKYDLLLWLKKPMDLGIKVRGKPLFGANKTWRGLVISTFGTIIFAYVHFLLYFRFPFFKKICIVPYESVSPLFIGLALGIGMILGELPNSFLKRQFGIGAGKQKPGVVGYLFRLYDQIDLLTGAWVLMFFVPYFEVSKHLDVVFFSIFMTLVLHLIIAQIGYALGMRKSRF